MQSRLSAQVAEHILLPWEDEPDTTSGPSLPLYLASSILGLLAAYSVFFLYDYEAIRSLSREDGLFESLGAVFFFGASGFLFLNYWRSDTGNLLGLFRTRKNIFWLLLGAAFLVGGAEEMSWGQRVFGIETPQMLEQVNRQRELNFHNLPLFHGINPDGSHKTGLASLLVLDRMFSLFWFSYCFVLPLLSALSSRLATWLRTVNMPLVPLWLGAVFLLNYGLSKILEAVFDYGLLYDSIQEIKEANCAVLFFIVSVYFFHRQKTSREGGLG